MMILLMLPIKSITVTGAKNIGMRVDLGTVDTDDKAVARISPTAVNNGNISITDGEQNIASGCK